MRFIVDVEPCQQEIDKLNHNRGKMGQQQTTFKDLVENAIAGVLQQVFWCESSRVEVVEISIHPNAQKTIDELKNYEFQQPDSALDV